MSRVLRLVAAALLGVAALPAAVAAPAAAAACSGSEGVTVVVGTDVRCDADGGGRAASNFTDVGHKLTYATRAAGFVCRVNGAPASDPCVEASPVDAYWALFWSDGTSGEWVYSSLGVTSLRVPQGGSVAFVFQGSTSRTWPSVRPRVPGATSAPAAPRPTATSGSTGSGRPKSTPKPRARTTQKGSTPAPSASAGPRASAGVSGTAGAPGASTAPSSRTPSTPPTTVPPTTGDATDAASAYEPVAADPGPPSTSNAAAITGAAVVVLLAIAGGVVWFRRRTG